MQLRTLERVFVGLTEFSPPRLAPGGRWPLAPALTAQTISPEEVVREPQVLLGGAAMGIVADGPLAYLGLGPRIVVIDISQPENPREVSRSDVLPDTVAALALGDGRLYAAAGRGVHVFDVTDARPPRHLAATELADYPAALIYDSGRLWVATLEDSPSQRANTASSILVLDVSTDATPSLVAEYGELTTAEEIDFGEGQRGVGLAVDGELALVTSGIHVLETVDFSNLAAPRQAGVLTRGHSALNQALGSDTDSAELVDEMAFLEEHGLVDPQYGAPVAVAMSDDVAYLAGYDLIVTNLADPNRPRFLKALAGEAFEFEDVAVDRNRLYAMAYRGSLALLVFDIGDPSEPQLLDSVDLPADSFSSHLAVANGVAWVADEASGGLRGFTVGPDAKLNLLAHLSFAGELQSFALCGGSVVAADLGGATYRLDIDGAGAAIPSLIPELQGTRELVADGDRLFALGDTLRVLTAGSDGELVQTGEAQLAQWASTSVLGIYSNTVLVKEGSRLRLVDTSDPAAPTDVGEVGAAGDIGGAALVGSVLYVSESSWDWDIGSPPPYSIRAFDVAAPAAPDAVAELVFQQALGDMVSRAGVLYVLGDQSTVHVIDVSEPKQPARLKTLDLGRRGLALSLYGNRLFVAHPGGWTELDVSDPTSPRAVSFTSAPGAINDVVLNGDLILANAGPAGLLRYEAGH